MRAFAKKWYQALERKNFMVQLVTFSAFFLLCFGAMYFGLWLHHASFIWKDDGLEQQYVFFGAEGEWLRELFTNIFARHEFTVPMWTWQSGYGADYFGVVMNCLGNPVNLISAFGTVETYETLLVSTIPITLFLAGLVFIGYCRYKDFDGAATVLASLVYVFGGYTFITYSQIFMLWPLVAGAITLWGADRIFDDESAAVFVSGVALSFAYSVTMGFALCLLLLSYCLIRFFFLKKRSFLLLLKLFVRFFIPLILGIAISSVVFVPMAVAVLSQGRLSLERPTDLFYSLHHYLHLLGGTISVQNVGSECFIGFASVAALCGVSAVINRRKACKTRQVILVVLLVMAIFLCLPIVGKVFNGMAYPNNRWVWALSLAGSVLVAEETPSLWGARPEERKKAAVFLGIFCSAALVVFILFGTSDSFVYIGAIVLLALLALYVALPGRPVALTVTLFGSVFVCVCTANFLWGSGVASTHVQVGNANRASFDSSKAAALVDISDANQYRYDGSGIGRNTNFLTGYENCTSYNSFYNGYIDEFHNKLGLTSALFSFSFDGLDSRSAMEALTGVKYYVSPAADTQWVPGIFQNRVADVGLADGSNTLYETSSTLPRAFVYDAAVSGADAEGLSMVQRQDQMLHGVIIGDDQSDAASIEGDADDTSGVTELPYELSWGTETSGVRERDGSIREVPAGLSTEADPNTGELTFYVYDYSRATCFIDVDLPEDSENYLCLNNACFNQLILGDEQNDVDSYRQGEDYSRRGQLLDILNGVSEPKSFSLSVGIVGVPGTVSVQQLTPLHDLYGGRDDWAIRLPNASGHVQIQITFAQTGTYTFSSLSVESESLASVREAAARLQQNSADNISFEGNMVSCTADLSEGSRYLYLMVPYSDGWSATVDGEPAQTVQANYGFTAISLPAGEHQIQMRYETPGLRIGAYLTVLGFAVTCVYLGVDRVIRKKRLEKQIVAKHVRQKVSKIS